ncbi:MAG: hypothetical protein BGO49_24710 [Planctomycetales bacterium 71-10]|nr:MAG: hypothetical protein BGO49_24710 [Planctomycetales bacterium 71-10]
MPYVTVHVDSADVLDDLADDELRKELQRRAAKKTGTSASAADYRIPAEVARSTLDEAANLLRKMERIDLAFKLDEINEDYIRA